MWTQEEALLRQLIEACWARDSLARPTPAQRLQAINREPVEAAPPGQPGLKANLSALDVLWPESALMDTGKLIAALRQLPQKS